MFLANPVYSTKPSKRLSLDTAGHGPQITPYFSLKYTNFRCKIFYLHLQSSSASRKWRNANVVRFVDLVQRVRRDPSVTLRKFSTDTTGHGLRMTKRPADWYFSIFLFEKYRFLLEIFYLHLESSSASRKWKNLNVVLFADSVHRVRFQAWHL